MMGCMMVVALVRRDQRSLLWGARFERLEAVLAYSSATMLSRCRFERWFSAGVRGDGTLTKHTRSFVAHYGTTGAHLWYAGLALSIVPKNRRHKHLFWRFRAVAPCSLID